MSLIWLLLIIAVLGAVGGIFNALITDNGFVLPRRETAGEVRTLRPGFVGNIIMGIAAAAVFWGLYGPFAEVTIIGEDPRKEAEVAGATRNDGDDKYGETLAGLIGALVIGMGGARVLTSEVDKKLLKVTASEAASSPASDNAASQIASASPAQALEIAKSM